jgi:hypothetical protein
VGAIVMRTIDYEEKRFVELMKTKQSAKEKLAAMLQKQEKLLYVCFHILLNLAENIEIEVKMKEKKIIPSLCRIVENRSNADLLILVIMFLKKLSIFQENKEEMMQERLVDKLLRFIPHENGQLMDFTLRLLLNLGFDPKVREYLGHTALQKIVMLIANSSLLPIVLKVLYQISMEESTRSLKPFTDIIPVLMELVIEFPDTTVNQELIALVINLSTISSNCELMGTTNNGVVRILERCLKSRDHLLCKLVRNITSHEKLKPVVRKYLPELMGLVTKVENTDILVELLGILGNLSSSDSSGNRSQQSYIQVFKKYKMTDFLYKHLSGAVAGQGEDDVLLEIVILVGTLCADKECAAMIAQAPVIQSLCSMFVEKMEDQEITLQTLYAMLQFMLYPSTQKIFLTQKQAIAHVLTLLMSDNDIIRKITDMLLDHIMESSPEWSKIIRQKKFALYNAQWLKACQDENGTQAYQLERGGLDPRASVDSDDLHVWTAD